MVIGVDVYVDHLKPIMKIRKPIVSLMVWGMHQKESLASFHFLRIAEAINHIPNALEQDLVVLVSVELLKESLEDVHANNNNQQHLLLVSQMVEVQLHQVKIVFSHLAGVENRDFTALVLGGEVKDFVKLF